MRERYASPPAGEPAGTAIAEHPAALRFPPSPVLSLAGALRREDCHVPCLLDGANAAFVRSGRTAIALAMLYMRLSPGDEVLIPAYHCPTMVYPVVWAGATPRFYRIRRDLSVDTDDLVSRITGRSRVVMAAHFFGFPKDFTALRQICDQHGLLLLEDCAHAFFGGTAENPVGSLGDYAIASLIKFFPVIDGGCLVSRKDPLDSISLRSPGTGFELRSAINALEKSIAFGRLTALAPLIKAPMALKDWLYTVRNRQPGVEPSESAETARPGSETFWHQEFQPHWVGQRMTRFSRGVFRLASYAHNVERRRRNFQLIQQALNSLPGCKALYPELPDNVVPYAFPLLLDRPEPAFQNLRNEGLPIFRWHDLWEGVDAQNFPVSCHYGQHLIQISCHQELTEEEVGRITERIAAVTRSQ